MLLSHGYLRTDRAQIANSVHFSIVQAASCERLSVKRVRYSFRRRYVKWKRYVMVVKLAGNRRDIFEETSISNSFQSAPCQFGTVFSLSFKKIYYISERLIFTNIIIVIVQDNDEIPRSLNIKDCKYRINN